MASSSRKKQPIAARGPWVPLPLDLLNSIAFASLSLHASRLLFDFVAQLGWNARGNGDLCATPAVMRARGWTSRSNLAAAMHELLEARLLAITRRGDRRRPTLYALAFYPLDCDVSKLEYGPGCYATKDWESEGQGDKPTEDKPANWRPLRKATERKPVMPDKPDPINTAPVSAGTTHQASPQQASEPKAWDSLPGLLAHLKHVGAPTFPLKATTTRRTKPAAVH